MSMNCSVFAVTREQAERLQESEDEEELFFELQNAANVGVGQCWYGLNYLLTAASGSSAAGFLVEGGQEIGLDGGYGPARLFSPREVDDIHSLLVDISEEELWNHFDAVETNREQPYPFNWPDQPELTRRIYGELLGELKKFIDEASRRGQCLVVTLN